MTNEKDAPRRRSIIDMSHNDARAFLFKKESYCRIELPKYFQFAELLCNVANVLEGKRLSDFGESPRNFDNVNHLVLDNKDGRFAWRPLEIIHPALYVSLVNSVTERECWDLIRERFRYFRVNPKVRCLSLPDESLTEENDTAERINQWWLNVEQKSLELALDFQWIIQTDIVNCYASLYTHSVSWALHGKQRAKAERNDTNLIGNVIDRHIQDMRQGQTNGVPQGSILTDFISEMILGYSDIELSKKIKAEGISDYQILRYRDDYRIFVNNLPDGERILKCLTEVMIELGLKLNEAKTAVSDNVIQSSIKDDKLKWLIRRQGDTNLQKHLLIVHDHSISHPNAGSIRPELNRFYRRLVNRKKYTNPLPLISIVVDIAYRNPATYSAATSILSKLLSFLETTSEKREMIEKIQKKFSQIPNTSHLEIWLQRISFPFDNDIDFVEPLCRLVRQEEVEIWNNEWINSPALKKSLNSEMVVDREKLANIPPIVPPKEIETFIHTY